MARRVSDGGSSALGGQRRTWLVTGASLLVLGLGLEACATGSKADDSGGTGLTSLSGGTGGVGVAGTGGSGGTAGCTTPADCGTDTDCLGHICEEGQCGETHAPVNTTCDDGAGCGANDPCVCNAAGQCVATSCTDTLLNGDETDVDCGGSCPGCANGKTCQEADDCESGKCDDGDGKCAPCAASADCDEDQYCDAGVCVPDKTTGSPCSAGEECPGGNCVDGVCCDTACAGGCDACSVAAGADQDGTCQILPDGSAGDGTCTPYLCDGQLGTCPGQCLSNADCATGHYCNAFAQCVALLAQGAACSASTQCTSGNCVDGYCCNNVCSALCQACSNAKSGGPNGTCTNIPNNSDPDNECVASCNGSGACQSASITFGYATEFSQASSHSPNYLLGNRIVVAQPITLTHLAIISKQNGPNVSIGLYTESSGAPATLVASTGSVPVTLGVMETPVTNVALPAGNYWFMAVYSGSASVGIQFSVSSDVVDYVSFPFSGSLPATFPGPVNSYTGQGFNYYVRGY